MNNNFTKMMTTRKALSDSIKFEEPGSDEYKRLDKLIQEIDSGSFKQSTQNSNQTQ